MMKKSLVLLSLLSASFASQATPITISNADFNSQTLSDGAFTGSVQGWAGIEGFSGIYNLPETVVPGEAGAGIYTNALYMINDAVMTQTLNTNLASNTDYTLTFDIGDRLDTTLVNYIVKVKAAGSTIFTAINPVIPNGGAFTPVTLHFSTGNVAAAGNPIVIELATTGENGQVLFDNFTLDEVAGSGTASSNFGAWNHPDIGGTTFVHDTVYQAQSDGFITFANGGNCQGNTYVINVGDTSPPSALLNRVDHIGGMSAPVKSGQYWQVDQTRYVSTCSVIIGFLPLNP